MTDRSRGQADSWRLLAVIVAVTIVLAVAPAALGFAGIDIREESTDDDARSDEFEDGSLLVISSVGTGIDDDRTSLGVVELLVTPAGGSVNVDNVTVTWDGSDQYELTPTQDDAGDASFGVEGGMELGPADRALLRVDLGTDDIDDVQQFGERLEPGDTVTVTVRTDAGMETTETFTVPDPLPSGTAVTFD